MANYDKIAVLGAGAFGIALTKIAAGRAKTVCLWARDEAVCQAINSLHVHPHKLSHVVLAKRVHATIDLAEALSKAEVVILTLPMEAMESVLARAANYIDEGATVVSTAKGIVPDTLALPCDIIRASLPEFLSSRACYLSGPSFAAELALGLPTALTVASRDRVAALNFQRGFSEKNLRLYYSSDVVGVCVGGALKNVIAIAAGASTGLGLGRNALASLITRGLAEITRLAKAMGGHVETLSGLSGMGDLVLSCTDNMSRNHFLGMLLAQGQSIESALKQIGSVVEGAKSARAVLPLMSRYKVDLPISLAVYKVLFENLKPQKAISALLERRLKNE